MADNGLFAQMGAKEVDDFMTERVEPVAGSLAGIDLD